MTRLQRVTSFMAPRRLGAWTAAALLWLLASPYYWPSGTWALGIIAGSLVLAWAGYRLAGDRVLGRIALASYAVRVALTLGFYAVSAWHLPVLRSLQRGDGFLQIGGDGFGYHQHALKILDAWRLGIDLPFVFGMGVQDYDLYQNLALPLAFVYKLLGASLVHALLMNAWMGALTAIPAYLLAAAMAGRGRARVAAALVAFWPSSIIWSSQLLKDTCVSLAMLSAFCGLILLWRGLPAVLRGWRRQGAAASCWLGLTVGTAVMTHFRFYMGTILFGTMALVMGLASVWQLWHHRFLLAGKAVLLIAAVGAVAVVTRSTDFLVLCSPRYPVPNLLALGEEAHRAGNLEHAMLYYLRVVHFQPDHEQALASLRVVVRDAPERLGTVTQQTVLDISQAIHFLVTSGRLSGSEIAELNIDLGRLYARMGSPLQEFLAYEWALQADPKNPESIERLYGAVQTEFARRDTGTEALPSRTLASTLYKLAELGRISSQQAAALDVRMASEFQRAQDTTYEVNAYLLALRADPANREAVERLHGAVTAELAGRLDGPGLLSNDLLVGGLRALSRSRRLDGTELASLFFRAGTFLTGPDEREQELGAYSLALQANPEYRSAADAVVGAVDEELRRRQHGAGAISHRALISAVGQLRTIGRRPREPFNLRALEHQAASVPEQRPSVPELGPGPSGLPAGESLPPMVKYTWAERLNNYRNGMIRTGGNSLVDTEVRFSNIFDLIKYLPHAWALAFLAPFPVQWFITGGETGVFRLLSGFEVLLLYLLLWPMARAGWSLLRHQGAAGWCLVVFSGLMATILPYVVPNLGILFRLRLQYILPLLVAVGVAGTLPFSGSSRQVLARLGRMHLFWRGREAVAGRVAAWSLVPGVLAGLLVLAQWPVTTRFGVNYQWSSKRITLFEKTVDFISRDLQARRLAAEVVRGALTPEEKLLRAFAWVGEHVRPTPAGFPVVDDHVLHVIIRGYGAADQRTEAFALLAGYAGFPAAHAQLTAPGTAQQVSVAMVQWRDRMLVFDVDRGLVFRNEQGGLASLEELAETPELVTRAAGLLTIDGVPYARYFAGARDLRPKFSRMAGQRLWPRLRQEAAGLFGRGPEGAR